MTTGKIIIGLEEHSNNVYLFTCTSLVGLVSWSWFWIIVTGRDLGGSFCGWFFFDFCIVVGFCGFFVVVVVVVVVIVCVWGWGWGEYKGTNKKALQSILLLSDFTYHSH